MDDIHDEKTHNESISRSAELKLQAVTPDRLSESTNAHNYESCVDTDSREWSEIPSPATESFELAMSPAHQDETSALSPVSSTVHEDDAESEPEASQDVVPADNSESSFMDQGGGGGGNGDPKNKLKLKASASESDVYSLFKQSPSGGEKELRDDKKQQLKLDRVSASAVNSPTSAKKGDGNRGNVDTAAPFESVKEAVSKFGGIVDWKAHRMQTVERRKAVEKELEKVQEQIPEYRKRWEEAEQEKMRVVQELDSTKRLIEELKVNLERAQTEERQARQDSELARMRVEEMEQGIAEDSSIAARAQLEVAKARLAAASSELGTVREELEALRVEYASLVEEKEEAIRRSEDAVSSSKQVEKAVEDLTIELISTKESLEAAHAAHMEAEEHRIGTVMARDQDTMTWEKELREAEQEVHRLNHKIMSSRDLNAKLETASALLLDLKAEFSAYKKEDRKDEIQEAVESGRKELEQVRLNIHKSSGQVGLLKEAAASLRSEVEGERSKLGSIRQREGMAAITATSLEAELEKTRSGIALAQREEKQGREVLSGLPKKLEAAATEASQASSLAQSARQELHWAREEAEQAKAAASTMQSRLLAAQKEIEASRASERLALAAINALQESELARSKGKDQVVDVSSRVTLSVEEYYHLSKQGHEAEQNAAARVAAANSEIELAKESESRSLSRLNQVNNEMAARRESLKAAMDRAEKAMEQKLGVEQELRKWRSENERRRKSGETRQVQQHQHQQQQQQLLLQGVVNQTHNSNVNNSNSDDASIALNYSCSSPKSYVHSNSNEIGSSPLDPRSGRKKKKSFFPRILMFFARRKAHPPH